MATKQSLPKRLPALLAEIEGVVGREAAIKFGLACGGTRIYMPKNVLPGHWLCKAIGDEAANKLAAYFSTERTGLRLDVPMVPRAVQVDTLIKTNMPAREIALALRVHQRTVHRRRRAGRGL